MGIQLTFLQLIILLTLTPIIAFIFAMAAAFIVHRTKTGEPFASLPEFDTGKPSSYVGDLFDETEDVDDELSPAAERIRDQKPTKIMNFLQKGAE